MLPYCYETCNYLNENAIGRKIYHEITQSGNTSIQTLINWTRYVTCAMKSLHKGQVNKFTFPSISKVIIEKDKSISESQ